MNDGDTEIVDVPEVEEAPGTDDVPGEVDVVGQIENLARDNEQDDENGSRDSDIENAGFAVNNATGRGGTDDEKRGGTVNGKDGGTLPGTTQPESPGTPSKPSTILPGTSLFSGLFRLAFKIEPGWWLEKGTNDNRQYYRWRKWLDRASGKKAYVRYVAPVNPKRTNRRPDEETSKHIASRKQGRKSKRSGGSAGASGRSRKTKGE